jgi:hypothetical protein
MTTSQTNDQTNDQTADQPAGGTPAGAPGANPAAPAEAKTSADRKPTWADPLPAVHLPSGMSASDVLATLSKESRRGRLAGFKKQTDRAFVCDAFGTLYDRTLRGTIGADHITFVGEPRRKLPIIVIVVFALTLYPGVLLTHTMLAMWFGWYPRELWITVAWYVPATLIAIPALIKHYRASERASRGHAQETIAKIEKALQAAPPRDA